MTTCPQTKSRPGRSCSSFSTSLVPPSIASMCIEIVAKHARSVDPEPVAHATSGLPPLWLAPVPVSTITRMHRAHAAQHTALRHSEPLPNTFLSFVRHTLVLQRHVIADRLSRTTKPSKNRWSRRTLLPDRCQA